jgi:hypothetical protein
VLVEVLQMVILSSHGRHPVTLIFMIALQLPFQIVKAERKKEKIAGFQFHNWKPDFIIAPINV